MISERAGRFVHPFPRAGGGDQFLAVIIKGLVGDQFHSGFLPFGVETIIRRPEAGDGKRGVNGPAIETRRTDAGTRQKIRAGMNFAKLEHQPFLFSRKYSIYAKTGNNLSMKSLGETGLSLELPNSRFI
jgi:hypothetical protein